MIKYIFLLIAFFTTAFPQNIHKSIIEKERKPFSSLRSRPLKGLLSFLTALSPSLFFAVGFSRFLFWLNSSSPAHLFNQGLFKKSLLKNVKNNEIIKLLFGSLEF